MKIGKAIFNLLFWVVFLNLFSYHIHNNSWTTSILLTILIAINVVENVIGFKEIVKPIKALNQEVKK